MTALKPLKNKRIRTRFCRNCSEEFRGGGRRVHCERCNVGYYAAMTEAISAVGREVARGNMTRAKDRKCVDCGKRATSHDHRSYTPSQRLVVQPVCTKCNHRRGPAAWDGENFLPRRSKKRRGLTSTSDAIDCAAVTLMGGA